jgi:hypothetical protein
MTEANLIIAPNRQIRIHKLDPTHTEAFVDLVARAYKAKKPKSEDLQEIRKFLINFPEFSQVVFDMVDATQHQLIKNYIDNPVARIGIEEYIVNVRKELGYDTAPIMEKLLIESIVTAWLGVQWLEYLVAAKMGGEFRIPAMEFWQKSLTMAQRSYLAACETLAKIRKMKLPNIQLNIGDKQINVAGDLKTGTREVTNV